jgi:eukaryotic-like serine/threonine-protein kinase
MKLREFIRSQLFLRLLLYAFAVAIVIMWVSLKLLDLYTHHGRTIVVPDLSGQYEAEVQDILKEHRLRYVVNDSVFYDDGVKGTVFSQDPAPGTHVKKGRTIYLTKIAFMPEMVAMPDLNDLSFRQASAMLTAYGLKPGRLEYRPDIARNAVLQQKYNNGAIEPGTLIAKGTSIDLVLGEGLGENVVQVPLLLGLTKQEAISALHAVTLNVGNSFYLDDEENDVKVYKQHPDPLTRKEFLRAGSSVDLYYRSPKVFDFETYLLEQLTVPIPLLYGKTPEEVRITLEAYDLAVGEEVYEGQVSEQEARVFRQEPDYEEDNMIQKGTAINIWYRSLEDFELDLLETQQSP